MNAIAEFALIHLTPDPGGTVPLHELWDVWSTWTAARGVPRGQLPELVRALMALDIARPNDPITGQFVLVGATLRPVQAILDGA